MTYTNGLQVAEVVLKGQCDNQEINNTLYFKYVSTVTTTELTQLATDVRSFWENYALPELPPVYEFLGVKASDLTTQTSETVEISATSLNNGTLSGIALPNHNTFTITFTTANRGRSYRGRNFWPLLTESDVTNNEVSEARANNIRGVYSLMVGSDEVSSGWTWGVFSRIQNKVQLTNGIFTPIQSVKYTDRVVDSQRRRLPKRGR